LKKFLLYGHGGSYNHGAEAIVQTTIKMIRCKYSNAYIALSSHFPEQDMEFKLDADLICGPNMELWKLKKKAVEYSERCELARQMYAEALSRIDRDTVCLSVGGDTFCYNNWHRLAVFQERVSDVGAKSILWGCSVEPSAITPEMLKVLDSYMFIVTRESITYKTLSEHGLADKLLLTPDPTFVLEPKQIPLPNEITENPIVGINVSPLIIRCESSPDILMDNIKNLINYITKKTNYNILLIPHVMMPSDNDFFLLSDLWNQLSKEEKSRTYLLDGSHSAAEYKYAVSLCQLVICARTHVSIAAYSLGIPTLVIGYSVKARGIACDLSMDKYILDIAAINESNIITDIFIQLNVDCDSIHACLKRCLPGYMKEKIADIL